MRLASMRTLCVRASQSLSPASSPSASRLVAVSNFRGISRPPPSFAQAESLVIKMAHACAEALAGWPSADTPPSPKVALLLVLLRLLRQCAVMLPLCRYSLAAVFSNAGLDVKCCNALAELECSQGYFAPALCALHALLLMAALETPGLKRP